MESITDYWDIEKCATLKGLHLWVSTIGAGEFTFLSDPEISVRKNVAR